MGRTPCPWQSWSLDPAVTNPSFVLQWFLPAPGGPRSVLVLQDWWHAETDTVA